MHLAVRCSLYKWLLVIFVIFMSLNCAIQSPKINRRMLTTFDGEISDSMSVTPENDLVKFQAKSDSARSVFLAGIKLKFYHKLDDEAEVHVGGDVISGPFDNSHEADNFLFSNDYDSDRNDDDDPCLLHATTQQLSWWVFPNGTLVDTLVRDAHVSALDLSHQSNSDENLYHETSKRQKYFTPFKPVAFSAAGNRLKSVPYRALTLIKENLRFLSLRGNDFSAPVLEDGRTVNLTKPSSWARFPLLDALVELDLSNCSIQYLGAEIFANVSNLQGLYLSHNRIAHITPDLFKHVPYIMKLDLSYIESPSANAKSPDLFPPSDDGFYVNEIYGLLIAETAFNDLKMLTFLDLSHTKISTYSINSFSNLSSTLQFLSLCYSMFPAIPTGLFSGTDIKVLDLSGNPTATMNLHENCFIGINNTLEVLAFENSRLHDLSWMRYLRKLEIVKLGRNNINVLHKGHFANLKEIRLLDLSVNHLGNWYHRVFEENMELRLLNLRDNNINMLTSEMYRDFANLSFLALGENDFICTCVLRDLIDIAVSNVHLLNNTFTLDEEGNQTNDATNDLIRRSGISTYSEDDIKEMIKSEIVAGFIPLMAESRDNIAKLSSSQPKGRRIVVHVLRHPANPEYPPPPNVLHNLSQHHFKPSRLGKYSDVFPFYGPTGGALPPDWDDGNVDAEHSVAPYHPPQDVDLVEDLSQLTMPDGRLIHFKFVLLDYKPENYWCYNASTNTLHEIADLIPCSTEHMIEPISNLNTTHFLIIGFAVLALAVVVIIPLYLKWWYLKYIYFMLKKSTLMKLLRKEHEKVHIKPSPYMYDVFVSYSDRDRDWVLEELLPNIEGSKQVSICLHERDFQVGLSILENIIQCMDKSRCFLLVISKCFLSSQWCQFEMYLAQHRLFEARKEHLILIMLEDIPKNKRPKSLQYLMQIKTYIKWPTNSSSPAYIIKSVNEERKLFWVRLNRSLSNIEHDKIQPCDESTV